jgi:hypothetical protein
MLCYNSQQDNELTNYIHEFDERNRMVDQKMEKISEHFFF